MEVAPAAGLVCRWAVEIDMLLRAVTFCLACIRTLHDGSGISCWPGVQDVGRAASPSQMAVAIELIGHEWIGHDVSGISCRPGEQDEGRAANSFQMAVAIDKLLLGPSLSVWHAFMLAPLLAQSE